MFTASLTISCIALFTGVKALDLDCEPAIEGLASSVHDLSSGDHTYDYIPYCLSRFEQTFSPIANTAYWQDAFINSCEYF